jgi:integrase
VTKSPPAGIPFAAVEIERVMAACPSTLSGLRDRALIALTYRLRMRPHVLVKLTVEDCRAFARTAPEIQDWLDAAGITSGFVFRQVKWGHCFGQKPLDAGWVSRAIRLRSSQAGLDPAFRNATSLLREAA